MQSPLSVDVPHGVDLHGANHRASPWNLLLSVSCFLFFLAISDGCRALGLASWQASVLSLAQLLLNCLPWETERGRGGEVEGEKNDCVGVWCPPSFSVSVASPLYLILPGHQLLPEQHLLRQKTLPLRTTPLPSYPPNNPAWSLMAIPLARPWSAKPSSHCWNDCSDSSVFLIIHRDSTLSGLLHWAATDWSSDRLTPKQADRQLDRLDKSQEAQREACSVVLFCAENQRLCFL